MLESSRYLRVSVSDLDIQNGERQNGDRCPIRNALHKAGFNAPKVPWDGKDGYIRLTDPETGIRYEWDIPPVAFKWLVRFDRGETVEPLDFRLDLDKATRKAPVRRTTTTLSEKHIPNPRPKTVPVDRKRPIETF